MLKADLNGDGQEDVFIGSSENNHAAIWVQHANGFEKKILPHDQIKFSTTKAALLFDTDKDGDTDILECNVLNDG
ncbi:FG-GAP repeat domain-containing protein, partial [Salmonella enterica]|uniref:FG-GAP repeat domain-containing protein n=1 Tax=Salmonella enterica TaxID=28901 RepID=UPI003D27CDFA